MAEIEQLKQLQADLDVSFNKLFESVQDAPNNGGAVAAAKERVGALAQAILGAVLGPAFSIIGLSTQVSS